MAMIAEANAPASALLTDLYQLTMLQGYYDQGMEGTAVFEFFVRKLPAERNFLMAAGLEQALAFLEKVKFTADELECLANHGAFRPSFVKYLEKLRFTGDVHAMAEGRIFFTNEPILRITAPIAEAQLVESRLINLLHFQTLIASKAARSVLMAPDKLLVAFEHFARSLPGNVILLIDTYDTEAAAEKVVRLARGPDYPVEVAPAVQNLARQVDARQKQVDAEQKAKRQFAEEPASVV